MRKRGLFPAAAPRRGYNPTHPGAKRASFAAAPAARPRRRPPCTRPARPVGKARRRARPARPAGFGPVCPCARRAAPPPGNGQRPARASAPATSPACPLKRAAPFFRRAAAHRAPRPYPGGNRRRAPLRVPAGRPPPGVLPPAQGRARRPRDPTGPRQGVPAPARRAAWRVPPRGDQIPGRGLQETAAPSRVNFREIRDPGYSPPKQQTAAQKMDGCSLIPQCSGGCL